MIYILLGLMIFCSCEPAPREWTKVIEGHVYLYDQRPPGGYKHDPECGLCKKEEGY